MKCHPPGTERRSRPSLPVWEEWIEIYCGSGSIPSDWSLPVWEEWIEILAMKYTGSIPDESLPVWEEWIEMPRLRPQVAMSRSLPVWEEWIEISPSRHRDLMRQSSLPVWEEWIEITFASVRGFGGASLFPYGKSGLKSPEGLNCH